MIKALLSYLFGLLFFMQIISAYAQTSPQSTIRNIVNYIKTTNDSLAIEKIYLHTDKPFYTTGDTLRFKAYLFNAAYFNISAKSGIAYVEIANEQNKVLKREMVAIQYGFGWGNIYLSDKEFPQGNYILTAYTNWMRNYDEHYIFKKQFSINSPNENDLLIKSRFNFTQTAGKQKAGIDLLINKTDQLPLVLGNFQLKVTEGNKTWYRDKVQTNLIGAINFTFDVPEKAHANNLTITLQPLKKNDESPIYKIPVLFNRREDIDLQFMPEGGHMVANIPTNIAFKALSQNGDGVDIAGVVYNSTQQEVLTFRSAHLGMGLFKFEPKAGESYTARIKFSDGTFSKVYPLPQVKTTGLVLNINNKLENDSLDIVITASDPSINEVYVIGESRGIPCYGATLQITNGLNNIKVAKSIFPTGITRFTLLNTNRQPLNERMVYIDHKDFLRIHLNSNKTTYTTRDSVGMEMTVKDSAGKPVQGSFSVAVTDDAQVKNDSLKNASLKSYLLLSSELKGDIQDPDYYFPKKLTTTTWQHLDNLLLTQGWAAYNWSVIFKPLKPAVYTAEADFSISGKVTNVFNKPVDKAQVLLLSKKPSFIIDTVTNQQGIFNFKNIYPSDTAVYIIQTRNKKGKSFNVGIEVNEFKPPVFTAPANRLIPWYLNIDSSAIRNLNTRIAYKNEQLKVLGPNMLKEVKIAGQKVIKDSKNLNGPGESDFAMNQEELQKAGKLTLGDLLTKNVKGFYEGAHNYRINDQFLCVIIDGIDILFGYTYDGSGQRALINYYKTYFDFYTAEDIKGIEVMTSGRYTGSYFSQFRHPLERQFDFAFIEITTYGGSGPFLHKTPGVYMYRPLAFSSQKEFYSPKYTSKTDHSFVDTRSTIYWAPNIFTDKNGKARFSFYTADKRGTYTLVMEGCDMDGSIGSTRQQIVVK